MSAEVIRTGESYEIRVNDDVVGRRETLDDALDNLYMSGHEWAIVKVSSRYELLVLENDVWETIDSAPSKKYLFDEYFRREDDNG
jgi:hypothetical protein